MAKQVYTYIIIGLGLVLLLGMAGFDVAGTDILNNLGIEEGFTIGNLTISPFYIKVLAIFAAAGVGGIGLGFLINRGVESFIVGAMASALFILFAPIFWSVTQLLQQDDSWIGYLAFLILIPYMVGFFIALVDYWRGAD